METPDQRRARLRQIELDADLDNAADLFGDVSIEAVGKPEPAVASSDSASRQSTPSSSAASPAAESISPAEIDIATLPIFKAKTKLDFENLAEKLGETLSTLTTSPNYSVILLPLLLKGLAGPLNSEQVRRLASTLTAISNEKLREEKAAENPKKGKKKGKPTLSAASAKINDTVDTTNYSKFDEFDDFM